MVLVQSVTGVKSDYGGVWVHQHRVVDPDKGNLIVVVATGDLASYDVVVGEQYVVADDGAGIEMWNEGEPVHAVMVEDVETKVCHGWIFITAKPSVDLDIRFEALGGEICIVHVVEGKLGIRTVNGTCGD